MRNFKLLLLTGIVISASLFIYSCSKDENINSENLSIDAELKKFDKVGQAHNAALDYLASKIDPERADNPTQYKFINEYFQNNVALSGSEKLIFENKSINGCGCEPKYFTFSDFINENGHKLSKFELSLTQKIENILKQSSSKEINLIVKSIREIEIEALSSKEDINLYRFLGTTSILRHSLNYWDNAYSDIKNKWYKEVHENDGSRIDWAALVRAIKDALAYDSCMSDGGMGMSSYETAHNVCSSDAAYASAQ